MTSALPSQAEVDTLIPLFNAGQHAALEAATQAMLARYPSSGVLWKILGTCLHLQRKDAVSTLIQAAKFSPEDAEIYCNLGATYQDAKNTDSAFQNYRKALALRPDYPEALNNYGTLLKDEGHHLAAVEAFTRSIEIQPDNADAHGNLGLALIALNEIDLAMPHLQHAVELQPQSATTHFNLGTAFQKQLLNEQAVASFHRATELVPTFHEAHNGLGNALRNLGRLQEAIDSLLTADRLSPDTAEIHANLGAAFQDQGEFERAAQHYRHARHLKPGDADIYSSMLFCLSHCGDITSQELFDAHLDFAKQFELPQRQHWPNHSNSKNPDRCIEVGFVSGDFRNHALASFIEPIFRALAQDPTFSLHAYSNHTAQESATHRIQDLVSHWHSVATLSDEALAKQIQSDRIDILIDLSGHTAHHRLTCFARKPAPIQCSWMGYPGTTGLSAMDYYIANPRFLPEKLFAGQFSEKFLYLPVGAPFTVSDHAPAVNELPALRNGFLTWGSFNRPNKISHQVIELWAQAMLAVPGSRLVLGAMFGDDDSERLSTWFEMHGIERQRLDFHVRCSMDQYLAHHHQVDICLDTFPYNGGTTTFHAMSMGVPTLSLSGQTPAGRSSASILGNAGLQDFVADSPSQFIDTARYWSLHLDELAALRRELRERLQSAALGESSVLTSSLALGLRAAWRRWCADAAPSHIYSEITGTQNGKRGTP